MNDTVTVHRVGAECRPLIERLAQLERHDLSEFRGTVPDETGHYRFRDLNLYFCEPARGIHLIHRGKDLAGFALTRPLDDGTPTIGAFFIVRALRRAGTGRDAALALLRERPGPWMIAFQEENAGAARFWRRVAGLAAEDTWREERHPVPGKPWIPPDTYLYLTVPQEVSPM